MGKYAKVLKITNLFVVHIGDFSTSEGNPKENKVYKKNPKQNFPSTFGGKMKGRKRLVLSFPLYCSCPSLVETSLSHAMKLIFN